MRIILTCLFLSTLLSLSSCKKFLDKAPDKKLAIPKDVKDLQALLDNDQMTEAGVVLADMSSDDYYLKYADWQSRGTVARNSYTWEKDIFEGGLITDWIEAYKKIYWCNVVLEGLKDMERTTANQTEWDMARGHALFSRAFRFQNLTEAFSYPYKPATATTDMGIPLRIKPLLDEIVPRASVQQTFERIIQDLMEAKDLLPAQVDIPHRNRPSKPAVFALIARTYLVMQDYDKALVYADSCLNLYNVIVDYASVNPTLLRPFPGSPTEFPEVIYRHVQHDYSVFSSTIANADTTLFAMYNINDRRRDIYFGINGASRYYKGQYSGNSLLFCGLATDEVYFIKAECLARKGNISAAMGALNAVLTKRWIGTFTPYNPIDAEDALRIVLKERRKELVCRGLRWSDLRRLNQDPRFAITLTRILNGQIYTLAPNSPRYALPIPDNEIQLSGIPQNPR